MYMPLGAVLRRTLVLALALVAPTAVRGHVSLRDVSFAYSRGGRTVLRDITIAPITPAQKP